MLLNALTWLARLATRLPRARLPGAAPVPLDPIERVQRNGGGLPVLLEFARPAW
jgi:hypothetical protein